MKQSQYDGCLFYRFEPSQEHIEEKAGRHIDDFLVTGPEPNVERFLEQARGKLNMQDAVRLYKTGDEGRLLAMNLRKLDNGYSLQGKPLLIHRIATTLGMENAKTSPIPETINEKAQDGDEESLTPSEARNFRTCVGKAMYLSHHRPDIQHSVNTLSRSMRNPTVIAMRRLKKLTRYLLGTTEVYQELCPDPHAETLQVPVDSDWADDRKTRQSCSGGAVLFHGCAVLTWARTQKTRALSSAEAELVEVADTLKRAISELSERMRVISLPSHRRDTSFVERDHRSHQKGLRVLWCEGSVNGLCCTVCSSHSVVHLLFLA